MSLLSLDESYPVHIHTYALTTLLQFWLLLPLSEFLIFLDKSFHQGPRDSRGLRGGRGLGSLKVQDHGQSSALATLGPLGPERVGGGGIALRVFLCE